MILASLTDTIHNDSKLASSPTGSRRVCVTFFYDFDTFVSEGREKADLSLFEDMG